MGKIISKVADYMDIKNITPMDLVRGGMAVGTAYRAMRGDANITLGLIARLCDLLEADSISDLFEYEKESATLADGAQD